MTSPILSISGRTRRTPFTYRVEAAGVKGYTVYNRMLLPTFFESIEADYYHLKTHVQVWDVAVERQVEVKGPDAKKLVQLLTPRDLSRMKDDQCFYIPVVDEKGGMLNDPVAVRHSDTHYWISIADSDLLYWIKGLACGMNLEVEVCEPDVSPLGIQGPKADDLMARVFGDEVRDIAFFRYKKFAFEGKDMIIARSGYSKQGGFEIYVDGSEYGEPLWDALFAAGEDLQVRAGCPNLIERIEGGLLSYGNDMNQSNTPYECGLGTFCASAKKIACIGAEALITASKAGPSRQIRGFTVDGERQNPCRNPWPIVADNGEQIGQITSAVWSPRLNTTVAIGMVANSHWEPETVLQVDSCAGVRNATVRSLPLVNATVRSLPLE